MMFFQGKCNVFLYIDPYGIKALRYSMFEQFSNGKFNSIELLINMNSFGFIREACNAMGTRLELNDSTIFEDLVEYDPSKMDMSEKSIQALNEIADGAYWQAIIRDLREKKIDGYQAEERFAAQYCKKLRECFTFVLNMPLRIKQGQRPKYRMIHATNHPDGCLLMVDNICNRWEAWREIQTNGQMSLFNEDVNSQVADELEIEKKMVDFFSLLQKYYSLNIVLSLFFMHYGPICKTSVIKGKLKEFEKAGRVKVEREPQLTSKGRPTSFMEEKSGKQKVLIKWAN